jgi:hypothetical protein
MARAGLYAVLSLGLIVVVDLVDPVPRARPG